MQKRKPNVEPGSFSNASAETISRMIEERVAAEVAKVMASQARRLGRTVAPGPLEEHDVEIGREVSARVGQRYVRGSVTDIFRSPTSSRAAYEIEVKGLKKKLGLKRIEDLFEPELSPPELPARLLRPAKRRSGS